MPIYLYECRLCEVKEEAVLPVEERTDDRWCAVCGDKQRRIPTAPARIQIRGAGAPVTICTDPYPWEGTALEGKDMCNPFYEAKQRHSGEKEKKITLDTGSVTTPGARKGSRGIRNMGV